MKTTNWISLLVICLTQMYLAVAFEGCQNITTCNECTYLDGCGWCGPTQQCLPGTVAGPVGSTCVGSAWEYDRCVACESISDCRACNVRDADCVWCTDSQSCKPVGSSGCEIGHNCPCDIYSSCSDCINDATCQWCAADGICIINDPANSCQTGGASNFTTGCDCSQTFDCPSCRNNFGCNWCSDGTCSSACSGSVAFSCSLWCSSMASNCSDCVNLNGCGWCKDADQCLDPSTTTCLLTHTCPTCSTRKFCDTCFEDPNCVWCSKSASCELKGTTTCLMAHTCESYCNQVSLCDACGQLPGCAWCDDSKLCVDVNTATCFLSHTCGDSPNPSGGCGFSGGAFIGGMFLVVVLVALVGAGWAFYKWRSGARISYTELK